jgi:hypothetical protein
METKREQRYIELRLENEALFTATLNEGILYLYCVASIHLRQHLLTDSDETSHWALLLHRTY